MGTKKTRFAHSSGRSRASMFAAALAAASGAYTRLPENVMRVNYSGRNAPTVTRCLMACRRMRTTLRVRENSRARIGSVREVLQKLRG